MPEHTNPYSESNLTPSSEVLEAMFRGDDDRDFADRMKAREHQLADIEQMEAEAAALEAEWRTSGRGWDPDKQNRYQSLVETIGYRKKRYAGMDLTPEPEKTEAPSKAARFRQALGAFFRRH